MGPGNGRPGRKQAGAGRASPVAAFDAAIAVRDDDAAVAELGAEETADAAAATRTAEPWGQTVRCDLFLGL